MSTTPIPPELATSQCDDSYAEIAKFLDWYDQNAEREPNVNDETSVK